MNIYCFKCKDCKYFKREQIKASRSGYCTHDKWKGSPWGNTSPLMGCGTYACKLFEKR